MNRRAASSIVPTIRIAGTTSEQPADRRVECRFDGHLGRIDLGPRELRDEITTDGPHLELVVEEHTLDGSVGFEQRAHVALRQHPATLAGRNDQLASSRPCSTPTSSSMSNGFGTYAAAPSCVARARSIADASAVTITTRGRSAAGSFASSSRTDHPSMRGIITSSTMRSGWWRWIWAIASKPSCAVSVSYPWPWRLNSITQTTWGSSSTTRTVGSPFEAMVVATAVRARTFMRPSAQHRRATVTPSGEGPGWAGDSRLVTAGQTGRYDATAGGMNV